MRSCWMMCPLTRSQWGPARVVRSFAAPLERVGMRQVLVLAYHFPPVGGGGVQRSVKFVRYLADFGYEAIVVTGEGASSGRWTPLDPSLAAEIPPSVRICRVGDEPAGGDRAAGGGWSGGSAIESRFARWWTDGRGQGGPRAVGEVDADLRVDGPVRDCRGGRRRSDDS